MLISIALGFVAFFLVLPLACVFVNALDKGLGPYFGAISHPLSLAAIRLTLATAAIAVAANLVFGISAAWLLARFDFRGKSLLLTLVDVPFSVSPVIAGLLFVLLFGRAGWFGPALADLGVKVIFAPPGIILATVFITAPFVVREVLPTLQAQGKDSEEAAYTLGATGFQTFLRVTLPNIKWAVLYGVVLCNARAMGEFGAVSVVSGHIRGLTNTLPLHAEILNNEYDFTAAFAVSSLLSLLALLTLAVKKVVEWRSHHDRG